MGHSCKTFIPCYIYSLFYSFLVVLIPTLSVLSLSLLSPVSLSLSFSLSLSGYGFVDFESPFAAEAAVKALQAQGIQAQMAKVGFFVLFLFSPSSHLSFSLLMLIFSSQSFFSTHDFSFHSLHLSSSSLIFVSSAIDILLSFLSSFFLPSFLPLIPHDHLITFL